MDDVGCGWPSVGLMDDKNENENNISFKINNVIEFMEIYCLFKNVFVTLRVMKKGHFVWLWCRSDEFMIGLIIEGLGVWQPCSKVPVILPKF